MLVAADCFTGEGRDVDTVYCELGDIGGISSGASQEAFQPPDLSVNLKALTFIIKLIMKISAY
ncbi:MAG: hypothetical protein IKJ41_06260 [Clostridia bacterium]|nr:hypothetical protein [Clostridia bacterium]